MLAPRSLPLFLSLLSLGLLAASAFASAAASPFPCTGGSIYFTAHNTDGLLFQNPDLLHDLYIHKCVTTVVFTSDSGGEAANDTRILERESALEMAYKLMNDKDYPFSEDAQAKWAHGEAPDGRVQTESGDQDVILRNVSSVQVGKYNISASALYNMPNVQILYLRLPNSPHAGQGYNAYGGESLKKLYQAKVPSITNTDKNATYTLQDLKDIVATILHERRPANIGILNRKIDFETDENYIEQEHTDRITSAKIVWDVIGETNIYANVYVYASDFMRNLDANLNTQDYVKKMNAFFEYAWYDPEICHDLDACDAKLKNARDTGKEYEEGDHISQFLKREYYAVSS